jgi:hypothetical protein
MTKLTQNVKPVQLSDDAEYVPGYFICNAPISKEKLSELENELAKLAGQRTKYSNVAVMGDVDAKPFWTYRLAWLWFIAGVGTGLVLSLLIFVLPILCVYGS